MSLGVTCLKSVIMFEVAFGDASGTYSLFYILNLLKKNKKTKPDESRPNGLISPQLAPF